MIAIIVILFVVVLFFSSSMGAYLYSSPAATPAATIPAATSAAAETAASTAPKVFPDETCLSDPSDWYLKQNTDVKDAKMDAWEHYRNHGYKEGRKGCFACKNDAAKDANCIKDPKAWYLSTHADVKAAGMDAWDHYSNQGYKEGRQACFGCGAT